MDTPVLWPYWADADGPSWVDIQRWLDEEDRYLLATEGHRAGE